jgi:hypothetical protein
VPTSIIIALASAVLLSAIVILTVEFWPRVEAWGLRWSWLYEPLLLPLIMLNGVSAWRRGQVVLPIVSIVFATLLTTTMVRRVWRRARQRH